MSEGQDIIDYSEFSMQELFRMEAENQTAILTQGLLDLEADNNSSEQLDSLMRAAHSIKGAARIVGLESIVKISHAMEDWFVLAQRGEFRIESAHIDLLLQAIDEINKAAQIPEEDIDAYLSHQQHVLVQMEKQLNDVLSGDSLDANLQSKLQSKSHKKAEQTKEPQKVKNSVTEADNTQRRESKKADRGIRVDAGRMNELLGLTSELVVESRWLGPFSDSMLQVKKRHSDLANILESLRETMLDNQQISSHANLQFSTAQKILTECQNIFTEKLLELDDYERRNLNISSRIYNQVVGSRMQPFSEATKGLQRTVRDLARSLNKDVVLHISGNDTPVDRDVIESIKSPLTHLLRNAIDHGIESTDERIKAGKNKQASILLSAHHGAGMLTIIVQDDGAGVDFEALKEKILQRKLAAKGIINNLSKQELLEFLYLPEFSTRDNVTEISGRGVGLDAVHTLLVDLHGSVRTETDEGIGCKFILQLPVSLSLVSAIYVKIAEEGYAFPLSRIDRLVTVKPEDVHHIEGRQYIAIEDEHVGLISATQILEVKNSIDVSEEFFVVIISARNNRYGVVVDKFVGERELSVQTLDYRLGKVQDISAAALTEEGEPVLIVDVDDMVRSIEILVSGGPVDSVSFSHLNKSIPKSKRVLVVDDSLTVREVEKKLLMNFGYRVDVAIDGMDGWNAVRRTKYDLLITDVDMPRMDGIEFISLVKKDFHLKNLPIMIVSYKDRYEDRQRGLEVGADYYLTKGSFHDETLIEAVEDLIGSANE